MSWLGLEQVVEFSTDYPRYRPGARFVPHSDRDASSSNQLSSDIRQSHYLILTGCRIRDVVEQGGLPMVFFSTRWVADSWFRWSHRFTRCEDSTELVDS